MQGMAAGENPNARKKQQQFGRRRGSEAHDLGADRG
jgi:hypothetical protein